MIYSRKIFYSHPAIRQPNFSRSVLKRLLKYPFRTLNLMLYHQLLLCSRLPAKEEESSASDPFAQFRFAHRRLSPESSEEDEAAAECFPSPPPVPTASRPIELPQSKPRLMISYNHASKPLCMDMYNSLTKDGYNVWIDLKQMHGSTLAAMAQAVEDSDIILYCVTQNYSQSLNCQKEAEYAFVRQKIMIPLLLQSSYKPIGWLGLLMGASLYIDFTKNDYNQNYCEAKE